MNEETKLKIEPKYIKTMFIRNASGRTDEKPINRSKAIHYKCIECSAFNPMRVTNCPCTDCQLYPYRLGGRSMKGATERNRDMTYYCLWCMSGSSQEVKACESKTCPLYPYRNSTVDKSMIIYTKIDNDTD